MPECLNCGSQVSEGDSFCPGCGAPTRASGDSARGSSQPPEASPPVAGQPQAPPPGQQAAQGGEPRRPPPPPPGEYRAPAAPGGGPQKRGISRGAKIAIILGVIAVLLAALVIVLVAVFFVSVISAPADIANAYVKAINDGDLNIAWGYLASETRSEEGRNGFDSKVAGFKGRIKSYNISSISVENATARLVMDLTGSDGAKATWDMFLVKESGKWKIRQVRPRE